jgi:hypothetical protein
MIATGALKFPLIAAVSRGTGLAGSGLDGGLRVVRPVDEAAELRSGGQIIEWSTIRQTQMLWASVRGSPDRESSTGWCDRLSAIRAEANATPHGARLYPPLV